jgi:hypothetical protein
LKRFELFIGKVLRPFLVLCHLVYLIFGFSVSINAQKSFNNISTEIIDNGFENVTVFGSNDSLDIYFENRVYRFNPRGIAKVIDIVSKNSNAKVVNLFPLSDGVKMLQVVIDMNAYQKFLSGEIIDFEFLQAIRVFFVSSETPQVWELKNKSNFKADLELIPAWNAKFGDFDNPVESNINLIPELNMTLSKGLTFSAQFILPLQNDHFFVAERETVRPGNITINQFVALEDNFFVNLTTGFFDKNRAGIMLDLYKVFLEGSIEIGAQVGFTDYYSFTGITTEYGKEFGGKAKYLTALVMAQYRYKPYDIVGRLTTGNHLFNVFATRFEVMRQFGEVQIGFFAMKSNDDYDAGFNFRIPLPPGKHGKIRWFRIRPSDNFRWEYRAKGFPQNGVTINTGYSANEILLENNPDFIKKRLLIEIKSKKY